MFQDDEEASPVAAADPKRRSSSIKRGATSFNLTLNTSKSDLAFVENVVNEMESPETRLKKK